MVISQKIDKIWKLYT